MIALKERKRSLAVVAVAENIKDSHKNMLKESAKEGLYVHLSYPNGLTGQTLLPS